MVDTYFAEAVRHEQTHYAHQQYIPDKKKKKEKKKKKKKERNAYSKTYHFFWKTANVITISFTSF